MSMLVNHGVVFLNIRKVFDSVNHDILLEKLTYYGVSEIELQGFQLYLKN